MAGNGNVTVRDSDFLRIICFGTTAFELLRTGLEFDVFERLEATGGMELGEIAAAIGAEEQPIRVLLLGLCSLRLLDKKGDTYVNSELSRRRLLRSSPRYMGTFVDIQAKIVNATLSDFAESIRRHTNIGLRHISGPGDTLYERLTAHPELQEIFYDNMGDVSQTVFDRILDRYDFTRIRHAIDLGGGDGANSIELARRYPHLEATVFDKESVTRIAGERIQDTDLRHRVHFHPGDIFADPFPAGDAILYFHIFEIWSVERNIELLRKCHAALTDGGVCLVYNFTSNDDGLGPILAGLMSPYFLTLASGEGMVYSPTDMERAVLAAGFSATERFDDLGFGHTLIVGHK